MSIEKTNIPMINLYTNKKADKFVKKHEAILNKDKLQDESHASPAYLERLENLEFGN